MEARFMAEKPADIVFTMKISMSAADWELLRDSLDGSVKPFKTSGQHYVVTQFQGFICDLLAQARKTFYPSAAVTQATSKVEQ
jgi:hypothetical protein